jgi:hypothetical protein
MTEAEVLEAAEEAELAQQPAEDAFWVEHYRSES